MIEIEFEMVVLVADTVKVFVTVRFPAIIFEKLAVPDAENGPYWSVVPRTFRPCVVVVE